MPRLKTRPPKLSKSGNYGYVYLNGERYAMGRWGSPEADRNYRRFVVEWATVGNAGCFDSRNVVTVEKLVFAYLQYAEKNVDHRDFGHTKTVSQAIVDLYAGTPTADFGPKALAAVQKNLEHSGRSRGYVNKLISSARTVFRWGVAQEMVPESVANALHYVQPLRKGKTAAPEKPPREDVPDEIVNRTLKYLWPTVAGMVEVQRLACMRPNEICRMKVGDLDTSGEIWLYKPVQHKGTWRGHEKEVALGKPEQEIIGPRLAGKSPENAVFSPKDTEAEKKERDAEKRQTPMTPSQRARAERRAKNPKTRIREHYDSGSYARSIKRSIEAANKTLEDPIPHWTPYQLRHAAVTEISETDGLDVARAVAGQKTINITQRYNHADKKIALKHAAKRKKKEAC